MLLKDMEDKEKYYLDKIRKAKEEGLEYKKTVREEIVKAQKEVFEKEQSAVEEEFTKKKNELIYLLENEKKQSRVKSEELGQIMAVKILGREV